MRLNPDPANFLPCDLEAHGLARAACSLDVGRHVCLLDLYPCDRFLLNKVFPIPKKKEDRSIFFFQKRFVRRPKSPLLSSAKIDGSIC